MEHKLFVGNIPFDCNLEDFRNAFNECEGYIIADLINNSSSGCYGFVIFENKENIEKLINNNNIFIKDRKLRLTRYNKKTKSINYIKLKNIPLTIKAEDINKEFLNYSKIGKCFIEMDRITGIYKDTGIIEILDNDIYQKLLKMESIYINNIPIEMSKYTNNIEFNKIETNNHIIFT